MRLNRFTLGLMIFANIAAFIIPLAMIGTFMSLALILMGVTVLNIIILCVTYGQKNVIHDVLGHGVIKAVEDNGDRIQVDTRMINDQSKTVVGWYPRSEFKGPKERIRKGEMIKVFVTQHADGSFTRRFELYPIQSPAPKETKKEPLKEAASKTDAATPSQPALVNTQNDDSKSPDVQPAPGEPPDS